MKIEEKEALAIKKLENIAKTWPKSLWLFSASGSLWVMKTDDQGKRAYNKNGGADQDYAICKINLPNDGGDW